MDAKNYFLNIWRKRFRSRAKGPLSFAEITDAMDRYRNFPGVPTCYELSVVQVGDTVEIITLVRVEPSKKWCIERKIKSPTGTTFEIFYFQNNQFIPAFVVDGHESRKENKDRDDKHIYRDTWGAAYEDYLNALK